MRSDFLLDLILFYLTLSAYVAMLAFIDNLNDCWNED